MSTTSYNVTDHGKSIGLPFMDNLLKKFTLQACPKKSVQKNDFFRKFDFNDLYSKYGYFHSHVTLRDNYIHFLQTAYPLA